MEREPSADRKKSVTGSEYSARDGGSDEEEGEVDEGGGSKGTITSICVYGLSPS